MDISKALWYLVLLKGDGQMKKQIIAVITVAAYVAPCASVWPRSAEVESLPAEPVKTAVNAEIEARSSETPHIFISEGIPAPELKPIAESNRSMCIEGRRYRICSVFPVETKQTPTDKLLALIDTELEKETHSA